MVSEAAIYSALGRDEEGISLGTIHINNYMDSSDKVVLIQSNIERLGLLG